MLKSFNEFEKFIASGNVQLLKENVSLTVKSINDVEYYDFGKRLRDVMWNWSTVLFYGNNYKGDPRTDVRVVSSDNYSDTITAGELFVDYWKDAENMIDNSVARSVGTSIRQAFGLKTPQIGIYTDLELTKLVVAAKQIGSNQTLKDEIIKWMKGAKISIDSTNNIVSSSKTVWDACAALGYASSMYLKSNKLDADLTKLAILLFNKSSTIDKARNNLKDVDFDFEGDDFGLDSWIGFVPNMPGWGTLNVSTTGFGWTVLWQISAATLDIWAAKIGAGILAGAKRLIDNGAITSKDFAAAPQVPAATLATPASSVQQNAAPAPEPTPTPTGSKPASKRKREKRRPNVV